MSKQSRAKQVQYIAMADIEPNDGQLLGLPANPREIHEEKYKKLKKNIEQYPELLEYRSLMVYPMPNSTKYIIIGGNMRYRALTELGCKHVPCIVIDPATPVEKLAAYTILDNNGFGRWDFDMLANEWSDFDLDGWGLDMEFPLFDEKKDIHDRSEWKNGENNEEYDEFLDKFKIKLTTDDCYTPPVVYDTVLQWAKKKYHISDDTPIVRPFFPGGDYEHYDYPEGCIVVDNPPFSILAQIMDFYAKRAIKCFMFCDMRTCSSSIIRRDGYTFIATNAQVVYENGAQVNTAFLTNMTPEIAVHTAPDLRKAIKECQNDDDELGKVYKHHRNTVVIAKMMNIAPIEFELRRDEMVPFFQCSKTVKNVFGAIGIIGENKAAELEAAELEAAERKAAEEVLLEPSDFELIARLNEKFPPQLIENES